MVGEQSGKRGGSSDDLVLHGNDRRVVDVLARLSEESDQRNRLRSRKRIPVGHGDAVLADIVREAQNGRAPMTGLAPDSTA